MLEKVIEMIAVVTETERKKICADADLIADLGLSSLDIVNLAVAFEDAFEIEIPDQDIWKLITVADIVSYLEAHV